MTSFAQKRKKKERKGIRPIRHFLPSFFMKIKKKELAFLSPLQGRRSSSFLQQKTKKRKEKDGERDHHSFLIFPSGRHGYPSFLYWRKSLCITSLFFSSLENEKKKEENASVHMQESFAFFVQTEEKRKELQDSLDDLERKIPEAYKEVYRWGQFRRKRSDSSPFKWNP